MANDLDEQRYSVLSSFPNLINCPACQAHFLGNFCQEVQGACHNCHYEWAISDNILTWGKQANIQKKNQLDIAHVFKKIRNQLNPLSSAILPFRYIMHFWNEKYYERTINDKDLAQQWYTHYIKGLDFKPGDLILDLGCGRGRVTALANQMGFPTLGQDITPKKWWKRINSKFQVVPPSCSRLPWRDGVFSGVICFQMLHFINPTNLEKYLQEIFRVLKPGGYCILLEANNKGYAAYLPRKHCGRLHANEMIWSFCKKIGFNKIKLSYEGFYAPVFPLFINYLRNQFSLKPFDVADFNSSLESITPEVRRALWLMKLQKPSMNTKTDKQ